MFGMLGGVVEQRIPFLDSLNFSEQLSYINYFNPGYGLKDINLLSFIQYLNKLNQISYLIILLLIIKSINNHF